MEQSIIDVNNVHIYRTLIGVLFILITLIISIISIIWYHNDYKGLVAQ